MKKFIFIFIFSFLIFHSLFSQFSGGGFANNYYYPFIKFTGARDTNSAPQAEGALVYQKSDSSLYIYSGLGWEKILSGSIIVTSFGVFDSIDVATWGSFAYMNVGDSIMVSTIKLDTLEGDYYDKIRTQKLISDSILNTALSAGFITYTQAGIIDNGDGTLTLPAESIAIYSNDDFQGNPIKFYLSGGTTGTDFPALPDGAKCYIVAKYNSGSPTYDVITNVELITEASYMPYITVFREGNIIHYVSWDEMGRGLPNKLHQRFVKTERFARESGLMLSADSTDQTFSISEGIAWNGASRNILVRAVSDSIPTHTCFYYHSTGTWTVDSTVTTYNITQYDDGTDLQSLPNNDWTVNWIYRIEDETSSRGHIAFILDTVYDKYAEAELANVPADLPDIIQAMGILVGRIIVEKGDATTTVVQSAFDIVFHPSQVTKHNDLAEIQGGVASEYYHLTSGEYTYVQDSLIYYLRGDRPDTFTYLYGDSIKTLIGIIDSLRAKVVQADSGNFSGDIVAGRNLEAPAGSLFVGDNYMYDNGSYIYTLYFQPNVCKITNTLDVKKIRNDIGDGLWIELKNIDNDSIMLWIDVAKYDSAFTLDSLGNVRIKGILQADSSLTVDGYGSFGDGLSITDLLYTSNDTLYGEINSVWDLSDLSTIIFPDGDYMFDVLKSTQPDTFGYVGTATYPYQRAWIDTITAGHIMSGNDTITFTDQFLTEISGINIDTPDSLVTNYALDISNPSDNNIFSITNTGINNITANGGSWNLDYQYDTLGFTMTSTNLNAYCGFYSGEVAAYNEAADTAYFSLYANGIGTSSGQGELYLYNYDENELGFFASPDSLYISDSTGVLKNYMIYGSGDLDLSGTLSALYGSFTDSINSLHATIDSLTAVVGSYDSLYSSGAIVAVGNITGGSVTIGNNLFTDAGTNVTTSYFQLTGELTTRSIKNYSSDVLDFRYDAGTDQAMRWCFINYDNVNDTTMAEDASGNIRIFRPSYFLDDIQADSNLTVNGYGSFGDTVEMDSKLIFNDPQPLNTPFISAGISDSIVAAGASTWYVLQFDSSKLNTDTTYFEFAPNDDSTKILIKKAGYIHVTYFLPWYSKGVNANTTVAGVIYKNNVMFIKSGEVETRDFANTDIEQLVRTKKIDVAVNDTIEIGYYTTDVDVYLKSAGIFTYNHYAGSVEIEWVY